MLGQAVARNQWIYLMAAIKLSDDEDKPRSTTGFRGDDGGRTTAIEDEAAVQSAECMLSP
jgi:hypothetical protein